MLGHMICIFCSSSLELRAGNHPRRDPASVRFIMGVQENVFYYLQGHYVQQSHKLRLFLNHHGDLSWSEKKKWPQLWPFLDLKFWLISCLSWRTQCPFFKYKKTQSLMTIIPFWWDLFSCQQSPLIDPVVWVVLKAQNNCSLTTFFCAFSFLSSED